MVTHVRSNWQSSFEVTRPKIKVKGQGHWGGNVKIVFDANLPRKMHRFIYNQYHDDPQLINN